MRINDQLVEIYQSYQSLSQHTGNGRKGGQLSRNVYPKGRRLRIEELEDRALLSVTAGEYAEIRTTYADLGLSKTMSDVNIIEVESNSLSVSNLKAAIATAGTTAGDDLIVLRTTDASNKITYATEADEISININAAEKGKLTIVGFGTPSLTIDAKQFSRVMSISSGADVSLANLTITGGRGLESGGGIYATGTLTMTNCTISGNSAISSPSTSVYFSYGGGIYATGTLTLTNCMISSNSATTLSYDSYGGGIYASGTTTLTNCTISGNSAAGTYTSSGGGIYNSTTLTLTNCTISGNSTSAPSSYGGGIYNSTTLTLTNCTISGNSSSNKGGGIYAYFGTTTLYNTIIAGNTASGENKDIYKFTLASDPDFILQGSNNLSSFTGWDGTSGNNYTYDSSKPLFIDSANGDYRLAQNSQAINKGNNSYLPSRLTTDIAGNVRIYNGTVDLGAYEYTFIPLSEISLSTLMPEVGATITTTLSPTDAMASYQWYRGMSATEITTVISDATASSYTVTSSDTGYYLKVVATGTGNYTGSVSSSTTTPANQDLASIILSTNTPKVGATITTTLNPTGATVSYQWYRGTSTSRITTVISGATSSSYNVTLSDIGSYLKVVATGTGNYTGTVSSSTTTTVTQDLVSIILSTNTPEVGATITTTLSPTDGTASYQWYRGTSATEITTVISDATSSSYTVTSSDIGSYLKVVVTGAGNYTGTVSSSTTTTVTQNLASITLSTTTPEVGATITTTLNPTDATASYQWYRGTSATEITTAISDATSSSYTVTSSDTGYYLKVVATGTGNYTGSVSSSTTTPANQDLASISLSTTTPKVGATITTTLNPTGATVSYQWYRGTSTSRITTVISGATSSSYNVTLSDIGSYLKVIATGTGNYTGTVSSSTTTTVTQDLVSIILSTNTPEVGATITTTLNPTDATASYQWYRGTSATDITTVISDATSSSYTVTSSDLGYYLKVVVTGAGNYTGTVSSSTTTTVTQDLASITLSTTTPEVGATITTTLNPTDATVSYQWYRGTSATEISTAISDATASSYTVTSSDIGYYLKVVATGTGNYTEEVFASTTATVSQDLADITLSTTTPKVGATITTTLSPTDATVSYQWYRGTSTSRITTVISGATSSSYTVTSSDIGSYLKVVATGTGNYTEEVFASTTATVTQNLASITLSTTTPEVGTTITTTLNPTDATASYQWYRGTSATEITTVISDATSSSYTVTSSDIGSYLKVVATGAGNYTGTVSSSTTTTVTQNLASIILSTNTLEVGATITTTLSPTDGTASYQWYRGTSATEITTAISDATSSSYTVTSSDTGYYLKVVATGTGNYTEEVFASTTATVTQDLADITLSTTTPEVGATITTTLNPTDATASYQWYRGTSATEVATAISDATTSSYTVTSNDLGYYLKVVAMGTGNYTGSVSASTTATVTQDLADITLSTTTPEVGATITTILNPTDATASYQWYRGTLASEITTAISDATASSYTVTSSDLGYYLKVVATGTGNYTEEVFASTTATVTQNLASITLSTTTPEVGATITTILNPTDATVSYQWYRGTSASEITTAISDATASSYTVTSSDLGYYLKVVATGTGFYTGSISASTTTPTNQDLASIILSTNTPEVGTTISTTLDPTDGTASYQWYRVTSVSDIITAISDATSSSYTVTSSDVGSYLKVVVTGTGFYTGMVSSSTTTTVTQDLASITLSTTTPEVETTITTTLNPTDATASYQWYRGTSATEITTAISDATASSYTVTSSDVGSYLKVVATGTGFYTGVVNTATTAVVPKQEPLVNTAVVFCTTPSTGDLSVFLPEQKDFVQKGQTVYAEIWLQNTDVDDLEISGGTLDLNYNASILNAASISHGSRFTDSTSGTIDNTNGKIDELGGGTFSTEKLNGQWVRLGYVEFLVVGSGAFTISLSAGDNKLVQMSSGNLDWERIDLDTYEYRSTGFDSAFPSQISVQQECSFNLCCNGTDSNGNAYTRYFVDLNGDGNYDKSGDNIWISWNELSIDEDSNGSLWLAVENSLGERSEAKQVAINVIETLPSISVKQYNFCNDQIITLDISASCYGRSIQQWTVNWGDESTHTQYNYPSLSLNVIHYYAPQPETKTYSITLNLVDTNGNGGDITYNLGSHIITGTASDSVLQEQSASAVPVSVDKMESLLPLEEKSVAFDSKNESSVSKHFLVSEMCNIELFEINNRVSRKYSTDINNTDSDLSSRVALPIILPSSELFGNDSPVTGFDFLSEEEDQYDFIAKENLSSYTSMTPKEDLAVAFSFFDDDILEII